MKFLICNQEALYYTYLCEYERLESKYTYIIEDANFNVRLNKESTSFGSQPRKMTPIKITNVIAEFGDSTYDLVSGNGDPLIRHKRFAQTEDTPKPRLNRKINNHIVNYLKGYKLCLLDELVFKDLSFEADTYEEAIRIFKERIKYLAFRVRNFSRDYRDVEFKNIFNSRLLAYDPLKDHGCKGLKFDEINILGRKYKSLILHSYMLRSSSWDNSYGSISDKIGIILGYVDPSTFNIEFFEGILDFLQKYENFDSIMYENSVSFLPENKCPLQLFELNPFNILTGVGENSQLMESIFNNNKIAEFIDDNHYYIVSKDALRNFNIPEILRNKRAKYIDMITNEEVDVNGKI